MSPSRTFILRPVATSLLMAAILLSGLSDGEQVVVDGVDKLRAGSKVQTGAGEQ